MRRRGKDMTNLEWLAENIDAMENYCYFCQCAHLAKYGYRCGFKVCDDCELENNANVVKALMEEHKEQNNE